ncbi:hypothetical protein JQS43_16650 [Natronosporangium hydrolyticum]|uniref:Uncharacterized protein n=1 Tax=Natronosporangium hydrolyticum TaxID=2811111 RepID=A0A895YAH4_9ACTN|nr:hypothetical protein [Natronosporangium hydrolyticum]QSB13252.1 hypothetical protein JQS43_16650 [Natronosporangium hydrolyticum]
MYAPAQIAHEVLTAEELLENVHENDVEQASALIYPEDHPRAGEIIPFQDWGPEQRAGWEKYISLQSNRGPILETTYDRMTKVVPPEDFRSRVHSSAEDSVAELFYPRGHAEAGEFIPSSEWEDKHFKAWEFYLSRRPANLPCP